MSVDNSAMGEELCPIYERLATECTLAYTRWNVYKGLFMQKEELAVVLSATTNLPFRVIHDELWRGTLLYLSRFTDPEYSKARGRATRSLSLDTLQNCSAALPVEGLRRLVSEAYRKCEFARDWRHRKLAHNDFEHALGKSDARLASATPKDVEEALASVAAALNAVAFHFTGSTTWHHEIDGERGARWIVHELALVQRLRNERRQRMMDGRSTPEDEDWKKWR